MLAIEGQTARDVTATVNYVRNPRASAAEPHLEFCTENESLSTMDTLPGRSVTIHAARDLATSLDHEGFVLVPHVSAVEDFRLIEEDPAVDQLYIDEMATLLRETTGGVFAMLLGGGKKRFGESASDLLAPLINAKPARYAHADNTDESAAQLFARITEAAGDRLPKNARWALYNMWRAVSPPPQDFPLAVCDAGSVAPTDEVTVTAVTSTRETGEMRHDTTGYLYNPQHRWHYFPDMTRDEVIIFKAHDSRDDVTRRVPHTAFTDPDCPPGTPTRASVEARGLVIFL
ncbi:CmcJ/NvfI family oxidoreductase [Novosphingobium sp. JCM 18896]|uniref:CmcJ/NvfI family oxidoreductase n=1 Tax=Novosphingobium sp. JCM 18896 TaxID=2989731 RepID=UPI0022221AEA|nr:CmcJ/NvfI family oxidoreductase [Novosphingobium sp. JCM 18896]MCW1429528.1 hypothetical protein [Novosphingobium sp. JCM 18896]